jgi:hypothetical protein
VERGLGVEREMKMLVFALAITAASTQVRRR